MDKTTPKPIGTNKTTEINKKGIMKQQNKPGDTQKSVSIMVATSTTFSCEELPEIVSKDIEKVIKMIDASQILQSDLKDIESKTISSIKDIFAKLTERKKAYISKTVKDFETSFTEQFYEKNPEFPKVKCSMCNSYIKMIYSDLTGCPKCSQVICKVCLSDNHPLSSCNIAKATS